MNANGLGILDFTTESMQGIQFEISSQSANEDGNSGSSILKHLRRARHDTFAEWRSVPEDDRN